MIVRYLSLISTFTHATINTCVMTETSGCIFSDSYDFATQFVCGAMQSGNTPPIYNLATQGCCNMGIVYSKEFEFCCANEIYPKTAGQCVQWFRTAVEKDPECFDCTDNARALSYKDFMTGKNVEMFVPYSNNDKKNSAINSEEDTITQVAAVEVAHSKEAVIEALNVEESIKEEQLVSSVDKEDEDVPAVAPSVSTERKLAVWPTSDPFDTIANGPSDSPCIEMDDQVGCYNTYTYRYVTHYPCYNWLLTWSVYGCCNGIPYRHMSQSCCVVDGEYVVKNANTWCTCQSWSCAPTVKPTKRPTTKAPTRPPSFAPSSLPTATFYPSSSSPTSLPTVSFKPTPGVLSSSEDDDEKVFKKDYLYYGGGVLVVGLGMLMYLQGRASRLIQNRHEVVLQIDEAN